MKILETLDKALGFMQTEMANQLSTRLYADNWLDIKPLRYYVRPIISFKIPYPYIARDYEEDRRGLFIGWYEVEIGKRKVKNENYKEEMKEYKKQKGMVYMIREKDFKWKTS